ncbi:class I SAM-dependent methyltransferase [Catenulispora sp. NL8]|uniref:Class I SAM-dependent methyltransferase n=1 Tax=Catenulispora pinistramenti TaxID=2705254 RepID=A0ABS5L7K6_9ACTN|nr:class I SAM-dependent methyltransferase [Catenulispora pinistramenti]MBS2554164.1 class I SAM-dependent methyltransferase [Catenulispora pinistramenti]
MTDYWNLNVAHHARILRAMPPNCRSALDIGCGDGLLAQKLAARAKWVVALDTSPEMAEQARRRTAGLDVEVVEADFLAAVRDGVLPRRSFSFVTSVAALHHMDPEAALQTMASLLEPGGRLAVAGLAMSRSALDWLIAAAQMPLVQTIRLAHGGASGPDGMPVSFDAIPSWTQARTTALEALPGARWRRTLQLRYLIEWTAPPAPRLVTAHTLRSTMDHPPLP